MPVVMIRFLFLAFQSSENRVYALIYFNLHVGSASSSHPVIYLYKIFSLLAETVWMQIRPAVLPGLFWIKPM